jgi:glycolate oxidase FAD binding subunit
MATSTRSLADAVGAVVGPGRVSGDDAVLAGYAVDGRIPRCVVAVRAMEDVARTLAFAQREGLAVVPRGGGHVLELGHPISRLDIVLDLRGVDAVVAYHPDDLTVSVEAGITVGALGARLASRRQFLPLDPPLATARTLGGITATNAFGPLRFRYGSVRDLLLGVRFVQPDGVVTWGGARVVKSVSGYDVPKLMVGALGTLGVIGELTLRLHAVPETETTTLVQYLRAEAAVAFVGRLLDSTVQPSRVEYLDEAALTACGAPRARAAVAVSIASVEDAVRDQTDIVTALAAAEGGVSGPAPWRFWDAYGRATREPGRPVLKVATLVTRVADTVAEIERAVAVTPGAGAMITGSCALGLLRVGLSGLGTAAAVTVIERLRRAVGAVGGSVVVESGTRELRERLDPWGPVPSGAFALMQRLRDTFDPVHVLNPGRFVGGR